MTLAQRFRSFVDASLDDALSICFAIFLVSGFLLAPSPVWAFPFYAVIVPLTVLLMWRDGFALLRAREAWLPMAVIAYFFLSMAWGVDQGAGAVAKYARASVLNFVFFFAGFFVFRRDEGVRERILLAFMIAGTLNAALSIVLHGFGEDRLYGFAETRHSILGASIIGSCAVIALVRLLESDRHRWLCAACIGICLAFVVLSRSRGPLLALAIAAAVVVILGGEGRRRGILLATLALAAVAAVAIALAPEPFMFWLNDLTNRESHRILIWTRTLELVGDRPILGHGLAARPDLPEPFTFPHSLYLSALFYGGAIGLALLLAMLADFLRWAFRLEARAERALAVGLIVHAALSGVTDLGQPLRGPSELWYILWLPIIAAAGFIAGSRRARYVRGPRAA